MTLNEILKQLKAGNEKMRAHNTKYGAGDNQIACCQGAFLEASRGRTGRAPRG